MPALLGNQVDLYAGSLPSVLPFVQSGRARCLLSTTKERVSVLPNVMAARDLGFPEHGSSSWHGIVAPAQTPRDRMLVLEKAFRDAARQSAIEKKLEEQGLQVVASSGEEFGQFLEAEYKAYGVVIKKLGLDVR